MKLSILDIFVLNTHWPSEAWRFFVCSISYKMTYRLLFKYYILSKWTQLSLLSVGAWYRYCCGLFSQLKFSCGWWILIGQKTKRSKERYKSWEISDVTDITMKQIPMGNVNFWISPEKAVSKVRQLLHLECQSSLRLILVVNMSNVNTRNRKPGLVWTCWNWSYEKPQFTVHRTRPN